MITKKDLITFSQILKTIEKRSTCIKHNVGAIILKDSRIISMGWNGSPSNRPHCNHYYSDNFNPIQHTQSIVGIDFLQNPKIEHHQFAVYNEIHAEQNAIGYAAKNGISTKNTIMLISLSPCLHCAKLIISAGIKEVYYDKKFDSDEANYAITMLRLSNIQVISFEDLLVNSP